MVRKMLLEKVQQSNATTYNYRKLAKRLKTNEVRDQEKLYYLLISSLIIAFCSTKLYAELTFSSYTGSTYDYTIDAVVIIGALLAVIVSHRVNELGDRGQFIERFICLSVPITILTFIIAFIAFPLIYALGIIEANEVSVQASWLDLIITLALYTLYIALFYDGMKVINNAS